MSPQMTTVWRSPRMHAAMKLQLLLHLIKHSVCCFLCRLCMLLPVHAMLGLRLHDSL
jgi:hypothetical protein